MNYIHIKSILPEQHISQAILVWSCLTSSFFDFIISVKTCWQALLSAPVTDNAVAGCATHRDSHSHQPSLPPAYH